MTIDRDMLVIRRSPTRGTAFRLAATPSVPDGGLCDGDEYALETRDDIETWVNEGGAGDDLEE